MYLAGYERPQYTASVWAVEGRYVERAPIVLVCYLLFRALIRLGAIDLLERRH